MKAYEIAYLLHPDVPVEEVVTAAGKITALIEKAGGTAQYVAEPKKRKLSYLVEKCSQAYFGYTDFLMDPAKLETFKKSLGDEKRVIRFLIVEALKVNQNLRERPYMPRAMGGRQDGAPHAARQPARKEGGDAPADIEAIDKKLDEILK